VGAGLVVALAAPDREHRYASASSPLLVSASHPWSRPDAILSQDPPDLSRLVRGHSPTVRGLMTGPILGTGRFDRWRWRFW
jgi:hypothetical protein